ncbi:MAG: 6-phosphogluconolactonase [Nitrospirales bacterium]|nr:MAG: 6-phosphogluconolactonase [Nitrospirales bacterium]
MTCTIRKTSDPQQLFSIAAQEFCKCTEEAVERTGQMNVALAGGSTPKGLYRLLASEPYRSIIDWEKVHVYWGDERHVSPDHQDSNYRMAHESLLSHVPVIPDHIHRMQGELPKAADAAEAYEDLLRKEFSPSPGEVPAFDLILLGMGPDGHTASLFPGTEVVHESASWVAAPWVEKFQTHRVTLTPVVLNQARHVMFLVSGNDKANAVQAVLEGPSQPDQYPSQVVNPLTGELLWLVDEQAAGLLHKTTFHIQ